MCSFDLGYLYDGRIWRQAVVRSRRLTERDILNVTSSERDILVNVIFGRRRSVGGAPLRPKTFD